MEGPMNIDTTTYRSPVNRTSARNSGIDMIVLHSTETPSLSVTANCFIAEKERNVSAHYVVDRDGKIYQFVPENRAAHHAGKAKWRLVTGQEVTDINSRSIGIEFQRGPGQTYTPAQIKAGLELTKSISQRYNIPPQHVVAHSDVAPSRKSDPGNDFPWELWNMNGLATNSQRRGNDGRSSAVNPEILAAAQQGMFNLNSQNINNSLQPSDDQKYLAQQTTEKKEEKTEFNIVSLLCAMFLGATNENVAAGASLLQALTKTNPNANVTNESNDLLANMQNTNQNTMG